MSEAFPLPPWTTVEVSNKLPSGQTGDSNLTSKANTDQQIDWESINEFGLFSPEKLSHTDLSPQDFGYALTSSLKYIPGVPLEIDLSDDLTIDSVNNYPKTPNVKLLEKEFFKKFDDLTLFYIFLCNSGTPQQNFAYNELQNREWTYNESIKTWFKKDDSNKEKNLYFDYGEERWDIYESNFDYQSQGNRDN